MSAYLLACSAWLGCLPEPDADREVDHNVDPLIDGAESGHKWSVGLCVGDVQTDGSCVPAGTPASARCTGTLVGRNVVLTARHCVHVPSFTSADFCDNAFSTALINETMQVTASKSVYRRGSEWHAVQEVLVPDGNNICTDDVVLLVLDGIVDAHPVIVDVERNLATEPPATLSIVGRGVVSDEDDGRLIRRILQQIPFVCASDQDGGCQVVDYYSNPPVFALPAGIYAVGPAVLAGDSGSGLFDDAEFLPGQYTVIGVNTLYTVGADFAANGTQGVRLDRHAKFLRQGVQHAATLGGYSVPEWAE